MGLAQRDKMDLIRRLLRQRISKDPSAKSFGQSSRFADELSDIELLGFPEATIVTCIESLAQGRAFGRADSEIARAIAAHRGVEPASTVEQVIRNAVQREHGHGGFLPNEHIEFCFREAKQVYGIT